MMPDPVPTGGLVPHSAITVTLPRRAARTPTRVERGRIRHRTFETLHLVPPGQAASHSAARLFHLVRALRIREETTRNQPRVMVGRSVEDVRA